MDRLDYIESVIYYLRGMTALEFQFQLKCVLQSYYEYKGKKYEMPSPYGGDDKNDGWVIEDAVFYQIYAPTQFSGSFSKNMRDKFKDDLKELLKKLKSGKWNGRINEFVFIVNTFDKPLPKDPDRYYEKVVEELKEEYGVNFNYTVNNLDYIRQLLMGIDDIDVLKSISVQLRIRPLIPFDSITEEMMMCFIEEIAANIIDDYDRDVDSTNYQRISTVKKIKINGLEDKQDEIETIIKHLDVVERAVTIINQDIMCVDKFERVKDLVINKYRQLSHEYKGVELLERMYDEVQKFALNKRLTQKPAQYLVIYIFDKCDIFEKEEGN